MKVIVCLDKNNGMMFNNRRQSRDRYVIEDILINCHNKKLWMSKYSEEMFNEYLIASDKEEVKHNILVDGEYISKAEDEDYCFIEDLDLRDYNITVSEIIIYRWDKQYPADMHFDVKFEEYVCKNREEIKGFSHEKIIKEIYVLEREK